MNGGVGSVVGLALVGMDVEGLAVGGKAVVGRVGLAVVGMVGLAVGGLVGAVGLAVGLLVVNHCPFTTINVIHSSKSGTDFIFHTFIVFY